MGKYKHTQAAQAELSLLKKIKDRIDLGQSAPSPVEPVQQGEEKDDEFYCTCGNKIPPDAPNSYCKECNEEL